MFLAPRTSHLAPRTSHLAPQKILLFVLTLFLQFPALIGQVTTQCNFPTGAATLCQQYGEIVPQIQVLSPTPSTFYGSGWSNQDVYINAELTVNSTFSIHHCTLEFGPSGKITIVNSGNLNAAQSRYFACEGWDGIYLDGTGILNFQDNHVEDAYNAITIASSNAQAAITNNYFNRNIVDLFVPPGIAANAVITGNTLDCTSNTFAGARSQTGLWAGKSLVTFGLPQGPSNLIRNHQTGIYTFGTILNVRRVELACNTDFGIRSILSYIDVRTDPGFSTLNFFFHNRADIRTDQTALAVRSSQFTACETDNIIALGNLNAQQIDIRNNTLIVDNNNQYAVNNTKTAIGIDRSSGGSGSVETNRIEVNAVVLEPYTSGQGRMAIAATGFPGTSDLMAIRDNGISIQTGGSHPSVALSSPLVNIAIGSANGFNVRRNAIGTQNIDNANFRSRWGFYLHGWQSPAANHFLYQNFVIGTAADYDYGMCAFHFDETGPWEICDNQTNYTLRGFHIRGACDPSIFGGNIMGDHRRNPSGSTGATAALILEENTVIGPQICRHNLFTYGNYSPDRGAEHRGNPFNVQQSRFEISPNVLQEQPSPVSPAGWFNINFNCADSTAGTYCGAERPKYGEYFSQRESAIIQDNLSDSDAADALAWEARRQVVAKMLRYPDLQAFSTEASQFFEVHINSAAGQYAQWDEMLFQAMSIDPERLASLQTTRAQITELFAQLDELDAAIVVSETMDEAHFQTRADLLGQISDRAAEEDALLAEIREIRHADLQLCEEALDVLPANTTWESNQLFLNQLALQRAGGETFDEAACETLRQIAAQCPEIAGSTREQAMNWLPAGDPGRAITEYGELPGCEEERNAVGDKVPGTVSSGDPMLWPNPVHSTLYVVFDAPFSGQIRIFNPAGGAALWSVSVREDQQIPISTQVLAAGTYLLEVTPVSGARTPRLFTVVK